MDSKTVAAMEKLAVTGEGAKGCSSCCHHPLEVSPSPEFIAHRVALFEKLKAEYDASVALKERVPIQVTLPNGTVKEGKAWETTPMRIARGISKSLAERTVIAKVDGVLFDLERPLESSCKLELFDFESSAEARAVFWHSSAHILGEACERHYACHLCIGPPLEEGGFYYEMDVPKPRSAVVPADFEALQTLATKIAGEKQKFERLLVSKSDLLEMFKHNQFKVHLINSKIDEAATVYRCGPLIDLCRGPHVPHTGYVRAFAILSNSSSYFLGDSKNASLQRVYGISYPDKKQLEEFLHLRAEALRRDHRRVGAEQGLFFFHELSPGSCFFLPPGAHIYNTLIEHLRDEYKRRGFTEVVTPNVFNTRLWETSGHWEKYQENMFSFEIEKEKFALKPMNCPGHCLMFAHRARSYQELPMRLSDFGVLHRNEYSGALTGLTRVRRFQQDDAHIFCTLDQVRGEIGSCIDFLKDTYAIFGFEFDLRLSTRPENFLGEMHVWDKAEGMLREALDASGYKWELNPGDGAFYGPKIDITIRDALRRPHQCATIQLDFQLPERFKLRYRTNVSGEAAAVSESQQSAAVETATAIAGNPGEYERPVMIHRAIYGSIERMIAVLIEHFGGRWPFWLSPKQVMIVPVSASFGDYAKELRDMLHGAGLCVDVDLSDSMLNKKIREAEIAYYNFIVVVGANEASERSVNVRNRDNKDSKKKGETIPAAEFLERLLRLKASKAVANEL